MRRNILIVDDDESLRDLVTFYLEQSGYAVGQAPDGISAFDLLRASNYDLILLDIALAHMNGITFLRNLRTNPKLSKIPVIMLTASGDRDDLDRSKRLDISDYILKPPQREDLLNRVERVLGVRPQFVEIEFKNEERLARGYIEVPIQLRSVSRSGLVLFSPVAVDKKFLLESVHLTLFKSLRVEQSRFIVTDCVPLKDGGYEFYLSFLGMNPSDQLKIQEWIMLRAHARKRSLAGAA